LVYFMAILVYFMVIFPVLVCSTNKNLATLHSVHFSPKRVCRKELLSWFLMHNSVPELAKLARLRKT
jgi:hypothetical protein